MLDPQHLSKLTVSGFRGLSSLDLDGLGGVNFLLGANDVGKTSILEAIFLLTGSANMKLPIAIQNRRNYVIRRFEGLSSLFHNLDMEDQAMLRAQSFDSTIRTLVLTAPYKRAIPEPRTQGARTRANGDSVKFQSAERGDQSSSSDLSGSRVLQYDVKVQRKTKKRPVSFTGRLDMDDGEIDLSISEKRATAEIVPARFFYASYEYEADVIANVRITKKTPELIKYLQVINPRVQDVATDGDVAYLDIGLETMMPLNMFGSGMVRATSIVSHCILGNDRILLIDELDNGLHYRAIVPLLTTLLRIATQRGLQIFITTHSLEVLEGLQQVLSQESFAQYRQATNCYALQRDSYGLVRPYRYEYDEFSHCITNGIEIR